MLLHTDNKIKTLEAFQGLGGWKGGILRGIILCFLKRLCVYYLLVRPLLSFYLTPRELKTFTPLATVL